MTEAWEQWGQRIREARKDRFSQVQLAEALEVDQTTISAWEMGKRTPPDAMKVRLAELLGEPIEQLFPWGAVAGQTS